MPPRPNQMASLSPPSECLSDIALIQHFEQFFKLCLNHQASASNTEEFTPSALLRSVLRLCTTWGYTNGMMMLQDGTSTLSARLAPFSVLPTLISRQAFDFAVSLSPIFTQMVANLTLSTEWLLKSLEQVGKSDPQFTKHLLDIARRTYGPGAEQRNIENDIRLILIRSDYMIEHLDNGHDKLKQVELNTISLSFAGLAEPLTTLHQLTTRILTGHARISKERFPPNPCCTNLVKALRAAHKLYCDRLPAFTCKDVLGVCLLFVVCPSEKNEIDQRHLEFRLAVENENEIPTMVHTKRMTFDELFFQFTETPTRPDLLRGVHYRAVSDGELKPIEYDDGRPKSARLFVADESKLGFWEVGVVYYRSGYDPTNYEPNTAGSWLMREVIERSDAIKCPNIFTHLAGVKKIQSMWTEPSILSLFLQSETEKRLVSQTFVDQVDVFDTDSHHVVQLINEAVETPEEFVLKSQREGGLHNIYDGGIRTTLKNRSKLSDDRSSLTPADEKDESGGYILMRRIRPQLLPAVVFEPLSSSGCEDPHREGCPKDSSQVGGGEVKLSQEPCPIVKFCLSELGTFGIHLADGNRTILNFHAGHLLRTKDARHREGGVATGFAFLDSPCLIDEATWSKVADKPTSKVQGGPVWRRRLSRSLMML